MSELVTEARDLCNVATPGPWEIRARGNTVQSHQVVGHGEYSRTDVNIASGISPKTGNAALIARSRTLLPEMADEIERLEGCVKDIGKECARRHDEIERLQAELDALKADISTIVTRAKPVSEYVGIGRDCRCDNCVFDGYRKDRKKERCLRKIDGTLGCGLWEPRAEAEALAAMKEDAHG